MGATASGLTAEWPRPACPGSRARSHAQRATERLGVAAHALEAEPPPSAPAGSNPRPSSRTCSRHSSAWSRRTSTNDGSACLTALVTASRPMWRSVSQGQLIGLCRWRDSLGVEAQRHAPGSGAHNGLDGLDNRLAIPADQAAHHVASAGESAFAGRDHDARLRRRGRIVRERSRRRERKERSCMIRSCTSAAIRRRSSASASASA